MDKLLEILEGIRPDIDFKNEDKLIDKEMLDSFDIISLVGEINEAFDVEIGVEDLIPDNFNSAKSILSLIKRLEEEG